MPKSRIIIVIAVVVALLPVLGFPRAWEAFFQVVAGLSIVALSVWSSIDKKIALKAKAQMRQARKPAPFSTGELSSNPETPEGVENTETPPAYGKRHTDFYPKTGQPGRRVSDLKPTISPEEPLN